MIVFPALAPRVGSSPSPDWTATYWRRLLRVDFVVAKDHREIREVSWALALRERAELRGGYLVELDDRILNGSQ
jgi:hypothetical protein